MSALAWRPARAPIDAFLDWGAQAHGSTRPLALMRIALAVLTFVRFGAELSLYQGDSLSFLLLGVAFFALVTMMLVGYMAQAACAGVAIMLATMYFYMGHVLGQPGWGAHHIYILLAGVSLLALSPCGRSYSVDRYRELMRGRETPERGPLWAQRLIALQLGALYFWTAVDKTNWSFLSGERLEQAFTWTYTGRALEPLLAMGPLLPALAVVVVLVEYALAFAIFVRPWRAFVLPMGLALHATFYVLLPVNTYSATMMALYLALLDPDAAHRFLDRMQGHGVPAHRL